MTFIEEIKNALGWTRDNRVRAQDTCAILIDMQESFVAGLSNSNQEKLIREQMEVIRLCASAGISIFVIELDRKLHGGTIKELRCELDAAADRVHIRDFEKKGSSAFTNREFMGALEHTGVNNLLVMGVSSRVCVRATVQDALSYKYSVLTSRCAIASLGNGESDLSWYRKRGLLVESLVPLVQAAR